MQLTTLQNQAASATSFACPVERRNLSFSESSSLFANQIQTAPNGRVVGISIVIPITVEGQTTVPTIIARLPATAVTTLMSQIQRLPAEQQEGAFAEWFATNRTELIRRYVEQSRSGGELTSFSISPVPSQPTSSTPATQTNIQAVPPTISAIPRRSRSFLDRLQFDFTHMGNHAGNLQQGQIALDFRPVRFSLGVGRLHLDRLNNDLFVVSPRVDVNGVVGRTNLFGSLGFAIVPENSEVHTSVFQEGEFGLTYDLIAERRRNGFFLRVGADLAGVGEGRYPFVPTGQGYVHTGAGVAAGLGPITVYGTARASIAPDTPIRQEWDDILRLHYLEAGGGVVAHLGPVVIGAHYLHGVERQQGTLEVEIPHMLLAPQVRATFAHNEMPLFGNIDEFNVGLTLNLEAPRGVRRITVRVDQALPLADHHQTTRVERDPYLYDGYGETRFAGRDVAAAMPGILSRLGRLDPMEVRRVEDAIALNTTQPIERNHFHVQAREDLIEHVVGRINGSPIDGSLTGSENRNRFIFDLATNLATSNSLSDFIQRYNNTSVDERIRVAATLASLGSSYYNHELASGSVFGGRAPLAALDPNGVYQGFQQLFRTGSMDAGICANINGFAAEFLRRSGLEAYSVELGSPGDLHIIALARDARTNTNYIVNYGDIYRSEGESVMPLIQSYAAASRFLILGIDLFGEQNQHIGHYQTPEGVLTEYMATGRERGSRLRGALIRRREDEEHP